MHAPIRFAVASLLFFASWTPVVAADLGSVPSSGAGGPSFADRFLNPAPEHRILKIIHGWPDGPEPQDALIRTLKQQGFGGVVCNISFTDYLRSEARWQSFTRAVEAAREAGFALWLYDEKGYPSAAAGGLVLQNAPQWEARGLLVAQTEGGGVLSLKAPPGNVLAAVAYPVDRPEGVSEGRAGSESLRDDSKRTNLVARIKDGELTWIAPDGRWRVVVVTEDKIYEGTHAAMSLSDHIPYPNLLLREPTAKFLELTHDRYAQHLGPDLGKWFISTFTDEPSLMSLFIKPMPYGVLPWSQVLAAEFRQRRGYDLLPLIGTLAGDGGAVGARARYDYWLTVSENVSSNFFGQIQEWCGKHNVLSGGHLLMEENLASQVPLYGDFFRCLRRLDAPSIDCLTSIPDQVPWFIARLASSAAALEQKTVVMCETSDHGQRYRPPGDQRPRVTVGKGEIKGTCNRLIVGGVNAITSYYSFAELRDEDLRELNLWIGRCCAAMAGGRPAADIAMLYPVQSVWPKIVPSRHYANDAAEARRIENLVQDVSQTLFANARDFTVIDERTLAEATPADGRLSCSGLNWRVIVLPATDTLPLRAWENLAHFVKSGGLLISIGALPSNSETEFPSSRVESIGTELFGDRGDTSRIRVHPKNGAAVFLNATEVAFLPRLLDKALEREFSIPQGLGSLRYTHHRRNGMEVFFLINDSSDEFSGGLQFPASGAGQKWDPATGAGTAFNDNQPLRLNLAGYGATVLTLENWRSRARKPLTADDLPRMVLMPLPEVSPTVTRGEFVREALSQGTLAGGALEKAWRASATLTKGQTDTFLFLRYAYDQGLNFSAESAVVFETEIPAGQRTANQLLVILHEKGGADYLAHTGRLLGASGKQRVSVPLNRFQLAGWSQDANKRLDLREIAEIRIGWGGYLGVEGEQVEFSAGRIFNGNIQ